MKGINLENVDWNKVNRGLGAVRVVGQLLNFLMFLLHHLEHVLF